MFCYEHQENYFDGDRALALLIIRASTTIKTLSCTPYILYLCLNFPSFLGKVALGFATIFFRCRIS